MPGPLPTAYIPGETYGLRLQLSDTAVDATIWGFELAALMSCPIWETAGDIVPVDSNRTRVFPGERDILFFSHSCICPSEDPSCCGYRPEGIPIENGWSFLWTAPARESGEVRFNIAINAANDNGDPIGDRIVLAQVFLQEEACNPPLIRDMQVRRTDDCGNGQPGIELLWANSAADVVRKSSDPAELLLSRDQWMDAGGSCQPEDLGNRLTFYSVGRLCELGSEGH